MQDILNKGLHTTDKNLYFIAVDTRHRLEIQFIPRLSTSRTARIGTMEVIGRNTPRYQNVGGEYTLDLTLDFFADEESRRSVLGKVRWLESLTFTDGAVAPAQNVILVWGDMFKNQKWVVKNVGTDYDNFSRTHGYLPQQAIVKISLGLDADSNMRWEEIAPVYAEGQGDGLNPYQPVPANETDNGWEDTSIAGINSFAEIMRRAGQRVYRPGYF